MDDPPTDERLMVLAYMEAGENASLESHHAQLDAYLPDDLASDFGRRQKGVAEAVASGHLEPVDSYDIHTPFRITSLGVASVRPEPEAVADATD